jgi:pyruvate,water dikinase
MPERHVIGFAELGLEDIGLVGGKCARLGDLLQAGFPVPPGFAVTTVAYGRDDIETEVAEAYEGLGADAPVAVRSSAVAEDLAEASFAGVQDTYLWVRKPDEVLAAVRRCWASLDNPEAVAYREAHGIARGRMAVAVQSMVDARVAGVMFTLNPVSGDPSSIAIDAAYGLGSTVVAGEVTPDSYLVSKVTGETRRSSVGEKAVECVPRPEGGTALQDVNERRRSRSCLEPAEIAQLVELARRVEKHYGCHQDLEWAIDHAGELFLLQSRPETVWSQKQKTVRQATADDPIAAIAAAFLPKP